MDEFSAEGMNEEQRIARLERKVGHNRLVLTIVALILVVGLSVSITIGILKALQADVAYATQKEFEALQEKNAALLVRIEASEKALEQLNENYQNGDAARILKVLRQQEISYREFLQIMKTGMVDLAKMVPGSRTWLDIYHDQIDEVVEDSQQRTDNMAQP